MSSHATRFQLSLSRLVGQRRRAAWLWAAAALMLLKAAVPVLAVGAAQAQGKALVEVCTVYGVSLVAVDAGSPGAPDTQPPAAAAHAGEACALQALTPWAGPAAEGAALWPATLRAAQVSAPAPHSEAPPDASARWAAARFHAPPQHTEV
jgi:hypothetical protein